MVRWGGNNLFPLQLSDLYNSSAIHAAITQQKVNLLIGNGIQFKNYSGLTAEQRTELDRLCAVADGYDKSLLDVSKQLALDFQIFGCLAMEIIWDLTFTKIIKVNRIPMVNVRIAATDSNGRINKFFFNRDWTRPNTYGTIEIPAFNINDKTNTNQILFIKNLFNFKFF